MRQSERPGACGRSRGAGDSLGVSGGDGGRGEGVKGLPSRAGGQCPRARYRWQHKRASVIRRPFSFCPLCRRPRRRSLAVYTVYIITAAAEEEEKEEKKFRRRNDIIYYYIIIIQCRIG